MDDQQLQRRRALSPDAELLSHLAGHRVGELEHVLAQLCSEESALIARGAHAAALALKRVEVVRLEDELARARVAASYRNPDR